jgi:hypothetical protein
MSIQIQILCLAAFSLWPTKWDNPEQACHVMEQTEKALQETGSDYELELLIALFKKESNFETNIGPNKAGACGLGQQIPAYTKYYAERRYTCNEIKDPETSIWLTIKAFDYLFDISNQTIEKKKIKKTLAEDGLYHVLCMYNQGPRSNCTSWKGMYYGTGYTRAVISWRDQLRQKRDEITSCLEKKDCELEIEFPDKLPITVINNYPYHFYK